MSSHTQRKNGPQKLACHTLIVSDTHLGKTQVKAEYLLELLQSIAPEGLKRIILNGDIFDGWALESQRAEEFPEMQHRVMDTINALAASGVEITYIPGNHDEGLRGIFFPTRPEEGETQEQSLKSSFTKASVNDFLDERSVTINFRDKHKTKQAPIHFRRGMVLQTEEGQRYIVQHGDQFDKWVQEGPSKWLSEQVGRLYYGIVDLESSFRKAVYGSRHEARKRIKFSLSKWIKHQAKAMAGVTATFEREARALPKKHGYDGMIAGHIHDAKLEEDTGYMNSGDWDDAHGCTALVYNPGEGFRLVNWLEERRTLGLGTPPTPRDENQSGAFG